MNDDDNLARYLFAVETGRRQEAIDVALELLQQGVEAQSVVIDLLVCAQGEVGRGWQEGRWSVAMEHRASAITESVLQAVVHDAMSAPGATRQGSRGRGVVACSEGEWHALPGQMFAEILRLRGVDVSFIGPSVPADDLAGFLDNDPTTAVAVTCSMPLSLVGAWRSISALRAEGKTIVCGGRGFGSDGRWALALGADHWAPDFVTGADLLLSAMDEPAPVQRTPAVAADRIEELKVLVPEHETLVESATQTAFARWPTIRSSEAAMRATREDLTSTLRIVAAATLVGDVRLVISHVRWAESLLAAKGLPLGFVPSAFELVLGVLPAQLVRAREMAASGEGACSQTCLATDYAP
jgi:methanogenic corrinoid protein MtbC1